MGRRAVEWALLVWVQPIKTLARHLDAAFGVDVRRIPVVVHDALILAHRAVEVTGALELHSRVVVVPRALLFIRGRMLRDLEKSKSRVARLVVVYIRPRQLDSRLAPPQAVSRWDRRSGAVGAFAPDGLWVVKAAV